MGMGKPVFCQFICPSGTLLGGIPLLGTHEELRATIGHLFALKMSILLAVLGACAVFHRFFCKALCPLGAVYGLFNKISFFRLGVDWARCVGCGKCASVCRMEVDPVKTPDSAECIRCGACKAACPRQAIRMGFLSHYPHGRPFPLDKTRLKCNDRIIGRRAAKD